MIKLQTTEYLTHVRKNIEPEMKRMLGFINQITDELNDPFTDEEQEQNLKNLLKVLDHDYKVLRDIYLTLNN